MRNIFVMLMAVCALGFTGCGDKDADDTGDTAADSTDTSVE